jgi:hypothetical protein
MLLLGTELLASLLDQAYFSAKMVFNERGAIICGADAEHRDQKAEGISYEDNYVGNALAAMLAPGRIEIRYHRAFKDGRVADIVTQLLAQPSLSQMVGWQVTYQGRRLGVSL